MFYPLDDSLKRGGKFHLCWMADSWPNRFAAVTHRQLYSYDIVRICDDLIEMISRETQNPSHKFSLRLSCKLTYGLIRLYEKKVSVFLMELCMFNAKMLKHIKEKKTQPKQRKPRQLQHHEKTLEFEMPIQVPEQVEEMIQISGNAVARVTDITLREETIVDRPLPYDGFGEENPNQALETLFQNTMESMLAPGGDSFLHKTSTFGASNLTESLIEPTVLRQHVIHEIVQAEIHCEPSTTIRDSMIEDKNTVPDVSITNNDVPVTSDIPVIQQSTRNTNEDAALLIASTPLEQVKDNRKKRVNQCRDDQDLEVPPPKQRRRNKLIFDKKTKLDNVFMKGRLVPNVDLRAESATDDIVIILVPPSIYFKRPASIGNRVYSNYSYYLIKKFKRNLGLIDREAIERDLPEDIRSETLRDGNEISNIEKSAINSQGDITPVMLQTPTGSKMARITSLSDIHHRELPSIVEENEKIVEEHLLVDISEQLTQLLPTDVEDSRKRQTINTAEYEVAPPSKRRLVDKSQTIKVDASNRKHELSDEEEPVQHHIQDELITVPVMDAEFSLGAQKMHKDQSVPKILSQTQPEHIIAVLEEAGLIESPKTPPKQQSKSARTSGSESETPLGSLDRTAVSLGESEVTTESKAFMRREWDSLGTMLKILDCMKKGYMPITICTLIDMGPVLPNKKRITAALCFNSILKLKTQGFLKVLKDERTSSILDIELGDKMRAKIFGTNIN